jgi:hypothetical protein
MMRLAFACLWLALALAGTPAIAQVPGAPGTQAAHARIAEVQAANERITGVLLEIIERPVFTGGVADEDVIGAFADLRPDMARARAALRAEAAALEALPSLTVHGDTPYLRGIDQMTAEAVMGARQIEGLFAELDALIEAVVAGDASKASQIVTTLGKASVSMIEAQARSLRIRAELAPAAGATRRQLLALSCYYEGVAAISEVEYGFTPAAPGLKLASEAADCADREIAGARAALAIEGRLTDPMLQPILADYVAIRTQMLDALSQASRDLRTMIASMSGGGQMSPETFNQSILVFESRLLELNGLEVELLKRLPR